MTDDLTTRLLAAIQQVEDNAVLATQPDQWAPGQPVTRAQVVGLDGKTQYDSVTTAILRHCAAHRKIVGLHAQDHECPQDASVPHPALTGWYAGTHCPTLLAVAEGYDLTTTEPAP